MENWILSRTKRINCVHRSILCLFGIFGGNDIVQKQNAQIELPENKSYFVHEGILRERDSGGKKNESLNSIRQKWNKYMNVVDISATFDIDKLNITLHAQSEVEQNGTSERKKLTASSYGKAIIMRRKTHKKRKKT